MAGGRDHSALATRHSLPGCGSWEVVQGGHHIGAPEGQQHEDEAEEGANGKAASALGEVPAHHHQAQVKQPDHGGPDDLRVAAVGVGVVDISQIHDAHTYHSNPKIIWSAVI